MSDQATIPKPVTRRRFLDALLGAGLLGWLATVLYPVLRYLKPLSSIGPGGPIKLSADEATTLERERYVIVRAGTSRVLVFEDRVQGLRALSAKCTHEGCTVQYVAGESIVLCACHNGRYDLDGRVLAGPPPRPLAQYDAQRDADGSILVKLGKS